jgi:hypothetical protein
MRWVVDCGALTIPFGASWLDTRSVFLAQLDLGVLVLTWLDRRRRRRASGG